MSPRPAAKCVAGHRDGGIVVVGLHVTLCGVVLVFGRPQILPRQAKDALVKELAFDAAAAASESSEGAPPTRQGRAARGVSDMDPAMHELLFTGHLANWVIAVHAGVGDCSVVAGGRSGSVKLWRRPPAASPSSVGE